jgi:hypothetical protein
MTLFVIRKQVVARSFARLRNQKTYTLYPGYLHLQEQAGRLGKLDNLLPDFRDFFERFFRVSDAPLGTPYIKPFTELTPSSKNLWLNENVAGSYAPSSLRPGQPFRKVVEVSGKTYSLPRDHAARAREHLQYGELIPIAELAVFLYRDYGLLDAPRIEDLIDIFAFEFGYAETIGGPVNHAFDLLYSRDSVASWDEDWLEPK